MVVCSLCQGEIDTGHSLRVDLLYGALDDLHDGTAEHSPERELAQAAYKALAGLRLLPSYGQQYRPYGNPPTWAHMGCYADWWHDQLQEARAHERADSVAAAGPADDEPDDQAGEHDE